MESAYDISVNIPLLSIVIPCFNDGDFIEEAVRSAINQNFEKKEVIVVNDGSDERTQVVLQKVELKIDKLITQKNKGAGAARNTGIKAAQGKYILVLDSDDHFESSFCSKAIKIFETHSNVKIVISYAERIRNNKSLDILKPKNSTIQDFLKYNAAFGSSMFLKESWVKVGGYDETRIINGYEDWDFYIRQLKKGGVSYVIPEVLFRYRLKDESNSSRANKKKYDLLKYIYFKHKDLYIENYEDFVSHLLRRLEAVEKAEKKSFKKLEFKIGEIVLLPMRRIWRVFNRQWKKVE